MIINLSPVFVSSFTTEENLNIIKASVHGDVIIINGTEFDFSILKKGHILPVTAIDSFHFDGPVIRNENGEIEVTLLFTHPNNASENMKYPLPIHISEGEVEFPKNTNDEEVLND